MEVSASNMTYPTRPLKPVGDPPTWWNRTALILIPTRPYCPLDNPASPNPEFTKVTGVFDPIDSDLAPLSPAVSTVLSLTRQLPLSNRAF